MVFVKTDPKINVFRKRGSSGSRASLFYLYMLAWCLYYFLVFKYINTRAGGCIDDAADVLCHLCIAFSQGFCLQVLLQSCFSRLFWPIEISKEELPEILCSLSDKSLYEFAHAPAMLCFSSWFLLRLLFAKLIFSSTSPSPPPPRARDYVYRAWGLQELSRGTKKRFFWACKGIVKIPGMFIQMIPF